MWNQFVNKAFTKQQIGILVAFSSLSILTFVLLKKNSKRKGKFTKQSSLDILEEEEQAIQQELLSLRQEEELLKKKALSFKLEYIEEGNILTKECIQNFLRESADLLDLKELQDIFSKNRQCRRLIYRSIFDFLHSANDQGQRADKAWKPQQIQQGQQAIEKEAGHSLREIYFRFVCTFDEDIKYLIEKGQKNLMVFLDRDYSLITNSIAYYLRKQEFANAFYEKMKDWEAEIRQCMRNHMPLYQEPLPLSRIKEIMKSQISQLRSDQPKLSRMVKSMEIRTEEELQCLPTLFFCYLEDFTFLDYGVEMEQIIVQNYLSDSNLQELIIQLGGLQQNIIRTLHQEASSHLILDDQQSQ